MRVRDIATVDVEALGARAICWPEPEWPSERRATLVEAAQQADFLSPSHTVLLLTDSTKDIHKVALEAMRIAAALNMITKWPRHQSMGYIEGITYRVDSKHGRKPSSREMVFMVGDKQEGVQDAQRSI